MFDALVTSMTLIAVAFIAAWLIRPDIRDWMEAPKYRFARGSLRLGRLEGNREADSRPGAFAGCDPKAAVMRIDD